LAWTRWVNGAPDIVFDFDIYAAWYTVWVTNKIELSEIRKERILEQLVHLNQEEITGVITALESGEKVFGQKLTQDEIAYALDTCQWLLNNSVNAKDGQEGADGWTATSRQVIPPPPGDDLDPALANWSRPMRLVQPKPKTAWWKIAGCIFFGLIILASLANHSRTNNLPTPGNQPVPEPVINYIDESGHICESMQFDRSDPLGRKSLWIQFAIQKSNEVPNTLHSVVVYNGERWWPLAPNMDSVERLFSPLEHPLTAQNGAVSIGGGGAEYGGMGFPVSGRYESWFAYFSHKVLGVPYVLKLAVHNDKYLVVYDGPEKYQDDARAESPLLIMWTCAFTKNAKNKWVSQSDQDDMPPLIVEAVSNLNDGNTNFELRISPDHSNLDSVNYKKANHR
jgi:hypothetical protein